MDRLAALANEHLATIEALLARGRARARHHRRRVHARPAGAAHDLWPLSRRVHRAVAAGPRSAAARGAHRRALQHGRRGDHDVGLRARSEAHGRSARLRRRAGELLWLHRRGRLRHRRLRGTEARLPARRPLRAGPEHVDRLRDRTPARAGRLRAGQLDHAAEAQPRARRASAPHGLARCRPVRDGADGRPQHAVHRHERFGRRSADRGLRRVRYRAPLPGAAARAARGGHDRRRQGSPPHRRGRHHARRARRLAGPHRGDLVPPGARGREPARAPHDRRPASRCRRSRSPTSSRSSPRRSAAPRASPKATSDASRRRNTSSPCARCRAGPRRHRSQRASRVTAPRSSRKRAAIDAIAARRRAADALLSREVAHHIGIAGA